MIWNGRVSYAERNTGQPSSCKKNTMQVQFLNVVFPDASNKSARLEVADAAPRLSETMPT